MLQLVLKETSTGDELSTFELNTSTHIFNAVLTELPKESLEAKLIMHCLYVADILKLFNKGAAYTCLLYTSPSPRD